MYLAPEGGWAHLEHLFETMAKLAISCHAPSKTSSIMNRQEGTAMDIILLTSFVSKGIEDRIERLESLGHSVFIIPLQHGLLELNREEVGVSNVNSHSSAFSTS